jgi:mRNA interferase RelE/StbE
LKTIVFTPMARADVRRIDRESAMRILSALHRFAESGEGDVRKLQESDGELRLRVGDYRVRFTEMPYGTMVIHMVRHRSDAYR